MLVAGIIEMFSMRQKFFAGVLAGGRRMYRHLKCRYAQACFPPLDISGFRRYITQIYILGKVWITADSEDLKNTFVISELDSVSRVQLQVM